MKRKKLDKKLSLNRQTVANLRLTDLTGLKGGGVFTDDDYTCYFVSCLDPTCPKACLTETTYFCCQ